MKDAITTHATNSTAESAMSCIDPGTGAERLVKIDRLARTQQLDGKDVGDILDDLRRFTCSVNAHRNVIFFFRR